MNKSVWIFKNPKYSEELTHWKRLWCWEGLRAGGEGDDRGWDGWMASLTRWTWVWVNSGSLWWTGRPGVLRFMGSQRVGHDWATELNWSTVRVWPLIVIQRRPRVVLGVSVSKARSVLPGALGLASPSDPLSDFSCLGGCSQHLGSCLSGSWMLRCRSFIPLTREWNRCFLTTYELSLSIQHDVLCGLFLTWIF